MGRSHHRKLTELHHREFESDGRKNKERRTRRVQQLAQKENLILHITSAGSRQRVNSWTDQGTILWSDTHEAWHLYVQTHTNNVSIVHSSTTITHRATLCMQVQTKAHVRLFKKKNARTTCISFFLLFFLRMQSFFLLDKYTDSTDPRHERQWQE